MPGKYASSGTVAVASPNTLLGLTGGTAVRFSIYDWEIGSFSTAPADVALLWIMARSREAGSGGTSRVPVALDPADPTSELAGQEAPTTEPDYAGLTDPELIEVGVNERATFRWVAAPGGELIAAAVASEGLCLRVDHASDTDTVFGTIHTEE